MLFRLLRALFEELFSPPKQAQPRRRIRTPDPAVGRRPDSMHPAGPGEQAAPQPSVENIIAQMFGLEVEPERLEEPVRIPVPEPVPQPAQVRQDLSRYTGADTPSQSRRKRAAETSSRRTSKVPTEMPEDTPTAVAPGARAVDMARNLRHNPDAARQAFIYSEIFGPPLADR